MRAALVDVNDLEVFVVVINDGGDELLSVILELFGGLGAVNGVCGLPIVDPMLLIVVRQSDPGDLDVAFLSNELAPLF